MNFWQRKLLAFLHDPPHKALDIQGHEEQAKEFIRRAGFDPEEALQEFQRYADYWAAAADRYPLFDSSLRSEFGGEERPFLHPMGGSELPLKQFPNAALLAEWLQVTQPVWDRMLDNIPEEDRDRVRFFLHWRRWPVEVCRDPENKMEHRWRSAYQVADTRMPDHPIWLHNSITSALQGCDGKPAFLIFQLGPVQEFIAQARSTRDLWSGSYLLSWLMAHAIKAVTDVCGPDAVIYPFLRAQPLFDLLHRDEIYDKIPLKDVTHQTIWDRLKLHENEILVPNLPNKFLAAVPASNAEHLAEKAEKAARNELENIANVCWDWLDRRHPLKSNWKERFFGQVRSFLQITWQTLAWNQSPPPEYIKKIFGCDVSKFKLTPNPGHWWSFYYQELDRLHAGRRNTRDFQPWMPNDGKKHGASKDLLSGKEEIVFDMDWWINKPDDEHFLSLFRTEEHLGAINVIKRVWHEAYLRDVWHLKPEKTLRFESVPDIAAAEWLNKILGEAVHALAESRQEFDRIYRLCEAMQRHAGEYRVRISKQPLSERNLDAWLRETAPDAFMADSWERKERIPEGKIVTKRCNEVIKELRKLHEDKKFGAPPSYVAIIALDGDSMGKWISGELTPPLLEQFSKEAKNALAAQIQEGTKRTLSPSYHLQFSEALANFALYLVRPIVEYFHGQVIYAGGDDVLAMVPASKGLECARALRNAFRGQERLEGIYESLGTKGGFVRLLNPKGEQPNWPLIVPGPRADVSAGIAIGHCHAPLQNLVDAARAAESKAKKQYREPPDGEQKDSDEEKDTTAKGAFCVSLLKRSGETLEWGARWDSQAIPLMQEFSNLSLEHHLSARFPYALAAALKPYARDWWDEKEKCWRRWRIIKAKDGREGQFDPFKIFRMEFERVLEKPDRRRDAPEKREKRRRLMELAMEYLGANGEKPALTCRGRYLEDFLGPFLTCAFISRRGGET